MREAVEMALGTSPALRAEQARVQALAEQIIQALNLRRPTIQLDASVGQSRIGQTFGGETGWRSTTPRTVALVLTQPLLLGGRVESELREAQLRLAQGVSRVRALQIAVARDVLLAYVDVLRDNDIHEIRTQGVENLLAQLAAAQARQDVGLIGLTDVAQVETRLAAARGQLAAARARLLASWAALDRLAGEMPVGLTDRELAGIALPSALEDAEASALAGSHELMGARLSAELGRALVTSLRAETGPRANLSAELNASEGGGLVESRQQDARVGVRVSVPLWNGGQPQSRIRAAQAEAQAARFDVTDLEAQVRERVVAAWANLEAARISQAAAAEQVRAADVARTGADLEQRLGLRTTIELLNQEQELLEARIALATARRELMASSIQLLALTGRDPTGVITRETEFDGTDLLRSPTAGRPGRPALWERPLILLHDVFLPVDRAVTRATRDGLRAAGAER
jgi:TolC family type I secretion outer membrane protein